MRFTVKLLLSIFTLLFSFNVYAQQEKMIFAVDLIRHGDRTATHGIPSAPYDWPQGLGQLTAKGMQQEYQVGKEFHKRYIEEQQLLPDHYLAETLRVRATDFDRTLMSAESALMGLYPLGSGPQLSGSPALPSAYQPIPIHTVALKEDRLLAHDERSPEYLQLLNTYVFTRHDWKQKTLELQPQFAHWSQVTGIQISHLLQLIVLGDTLYVRQLYQVPLPEGMSEADAKTIIEAAKWAFVTLYKSKEVGAYTGHALLSEINALLQNASENKSKLKFMLYSAHDSTILSLMSTMQTPLESPPPYASDLNIALYEAGPNNYVVKVQLNGKPVSIPGCGGTTCTLRQFEAL